MEILPMLISSALTIVLYGCIAAALIKLFQIATDLRELKDVLQEMKRNTQAASAAPPAAISAPGPLSPEALVRAVHAQSYESLDVNQS